MTEKSYSNATEWCFLTSWKVKSDSFLSFPLSTYLANLLHVPLTPLPRKKNKRGLRKGRERAEFSPTPRLLRRRIVRICRLVVGSQSISDRSEATQTIYFSAVVEYLKFSYWFTQRNNSMSRRGRSKSRRQFGDAWNSRACLKQQTLDGHCIWGGIRRIDGGEE